MSLEHIKAQVLASISVKQALCTDEGTLTKIEHLAELTLNALRKGGKIIFAGNGGSFADAQHLSAEFVSRFMLDRAPLASMTLGTNGSAMSAIGNDYGYEHVFARELTAVARPEDVFVPITTSGNSPNILASVEVALELGIATVGLSGCAGGRLRSMCDCICVPSAETARIQECHIMVGHILCALVEERYFQEAKQP